MWCRTLGRFALYADQTEARPLMEAGKPLAVLVYLALSPKNKASRDHVAELLWPGCELRDARHSLRQSLYRLREAAGGIALVRAGDTELELLSSVRVDGLEAERWAVNGERPRAYEGLRGNFLEGFSIPESREFESWAEATRARFRACRAEVARQLAEARLAAGDAQGALEIAEELVALQPFSEVPIRLLIRALAELGRHATALARFHAYAELLRRETEEEPAASLVAYTEELQQYIRSRPELSVAMLPFVGRERQWSTLEAAWEAARASQGSTVLIEGAAGLGKTRLLAELRRRVQAAGGLALPAKAYEIERAVPYATIAEALAAASDRPELAALNPAWLGEAARLLPELRERFPTLPSADDSSGSQAARRRLHQALARCLEALVAEIPTLVSVDDIQWADAASFEVLHLLSHRLRGTRTLLVATYRPAELSPVARQFARALCGGRLADLVVLDPLEAADVTELLTKLGRFEQPELAAALAEQLHRHSGGNPLFVSELLAALDRRRLLVVRDGRWQVAAEAESAELPRTLGKLLADRIDALAPWMRACVETLAVAAAETPVELLAESLELSEPRAELALAVLEEERLVKRVAAGTFELVHDELRRLVYQGIPDERRRLLHAAVGAALEAHGEAKRPGGAARLAYHFDQAGEREQAHRYALLAAGEAGALGASEARAVHLEMADAHAPKALPRRTMADVSGVRRLLGRHGIGAAAGAALAVIVLVVGVFYFRPDFIGNEVGGDYRQGTIYLAESASLPTHMVRWASRAGGLGRVEALTRPLSAYGSPLLLRAVTDSNETHTKVFVVRGRDTVQLTFGRSDDADAEWAPDGRHFLLTRGWRASETRYQQNLFLMDTAARIVRALTDSPWQDVYASWSPAGTRITFGRDSAGVSSVRVADADGANALNVTERFGLPRGQAHPALAPDDHRLGVVYADTGSGLSAAYVVDLAEGTVRPLAGTPPAMHLVRPLWSPDGRWLAYVTRRGESQGLWVVPADASTAPVLVAELPNALFQREWSDGSRRWAQRVVLEPEVLELRTGRGIRARATVQASDGERVSTVLHWSVRDTAVARVDDLGFVRGRSPGMTRIVASAGGFRADTGTVAVAFAPVETLFVEDWSGGLDTTRWTLFGYPKSLVRPAPPDGRPAFFNNGDYNHGSGAVSVERFEVGEEGLTLVVEAWLRTTGQHWQNWQIGFADNPFIGPGPEATVGAASAGFSGPEPTVSSARWTCSVALAREQPPVRVPRWMKVTLTVRPDGWSECWVDGRMVGARPLPEGFVRRPLAVLLRGMSVGTELYHGRVVVRRGVVY